MVNCWVFLFAENWFPKTLQFCMQGAASGEQPDMSGDRCWYEWYTMSPFRISLHCKSSEKPLPLAESVSCRNRDTCRNPLAVGASELLYGSALHHYQSVAIWQIGKNRRTYSLTLRKTHPLSRTALASNLSPQT